MESERVELFSGFFIPIESGSILDTVPYPTETYNHQRRK